MRLGMVLLHLLGCTPENAFTTVSFAKESPSENTSSGDFALMCPPTIPAEEFCPDDYNTWSVDGDCVDILDDEEDDVVSDVLGMEGVGLSDYLAGRLDLTTYFKYWVAYNSHDGIEEYIEFRITLRDYYLDDDFRNELNSWFQNEFDYYGFGSHVVTAQTFPFDHILCLGASESAYEGYHDDELMYHNAQRTLQKGLVSSEHVEMSGVSIEVENDFQDCDGADVSLQTENNGNLNYNNCEGEDEASYPYNIDRTTVPYIEDSIDDLLSEGSLYSSMIAEPAGYCISSNSSDYFCQGIVTFTAEKD